METEKKIDEKAKDIIAQLKGWTYLEVRKLTQATLNHCESMAKID